MDNKVILISVDGMRPDGLKQCKSPYLDEMKRLSSYTFNARTVFPSVTLPCHISMFHSITPERHGTTTNTYMPQVRPVNGLFEQLKAADKKSAMIYGWEEMRDISRPGSLSGAEYIDHTLCESADTVLTDKALNYIDRMHPDFLFLYMPDTDESGHNSGWMSDDYLAHISCAIDNVKRVIEATAGEYTVIVTADHGGHDRVHGTDMDEDMTIPMFICGPQFEAGAELSEARILDVAPTVADIMGIAPAKEWEGKSLLRK